MLACNYEPSAKKDSSKETTSQKDPVNQKLFTLLKEKDSLLFDRGYNHCDSIALEQLTSEDFEFYHDQGGITNGKQAFLESMKGLCNLSYKPRRELVTGSLEAFPLYQNGELYGAVQTGEHRFYALEKDKPEYLTSTAKFTILWIKETEAWKMKRVLSYDHQTPK
jgi:hypothetical protein